MWLRGSHSSDGETDEEDSSACRDPGSVLGAGPRPIGPDGRFDGWRHVVRQVRDDGAYAFQDEIQPDAFQQDDALQEDGSFQEDDAVQEDDDSDKMHSTKMHST